MGNSRTSKSIKNSIVALTFYFVGLVLQFISRKIFLQYLGTEILGLNTTVTNLLQFLNLAELGVGAAVSFTLYKPLYENDKNSINEIISLMGWMYRRIALFVIGGASILMCFFPLIFNKISLPLWYAYASFGVLLFSSLLGYFVNYKQVLLSADQKDYKIQYSLQSAKLVKFGCQICAMITMDNPYVWWLTLEVIFAVIGALALDITTKKTFPELEINIRDGRVLQSKYTLVSTKIKQVFFHKIGTFALTQSSPIIIYAYSSLEIVALYGNYVLITNGVLSLMNAVFNSMNAGVGNLVAEGNKHRILAVFEELFSIRFVLVCTLCYGVYKIAPDFISLWIGKEYLLDNITLALMVAILYVSLSRSVVDAYISAYGLYNDIWAPIVEACLNVGLSVLLGYFWGLHGILLGVFISLFIVILCWKPYWLFKNGFKCSISKYVIMYFKHIFMGSVLWIITDFIYIKLHVQGEDAISLLVNILSSAGVYFICMVLLVLLFNPNVRQRVRRYVHI